MRCTICERKCDIDDGGIGGCGMMTCTDNEIRERYPDKYLAAVDTAIESMPMVHFHPRGKFLQVCTVGCNFNCNGCVSDILTHHFSAIHGAFQQMTPEALIEKARAEACIGIMFCFNEPTVSYFTFLRLARMAKKAGLLMGCSTNAYLTESALQQLIPYLDFVNVGLKGVSEKIYRTCGVSRVSPILRNLKTLHQHGVYLEVSTIYRKNGDADITRCAEFVASLSPDIPFQVMRFIPFGDAPPEMEPSVREAEAICSTLRNHLNWVYLFNSPGTDLLSSHCPDCGATIMRRGFFGPMCSNLFHYQPDGRCTCGFTMPLKGAIHDPKLRETGYFGGYRTINALTMIRWLLAVLGVTDKSQVDRIMFQVLESDLIKNLHERLNLIDAYFETIDFFAGLTGREDRAVQYREYVQSRVDLIVKKVGSADRPVVYSTLGHPLIAMFTDKMESRLIEIAGGRLANHDIERERRPGITLTRDQFCSLEADTIIVTGAAAWPKADFIAYCREKGLDMPAVKTGRIFHLHPYRSSVNPDWILGLMRLANIIHPDIFDFDLEKEADDFYLKFYNMPFEKGARHALDTRK